MKPLYHVNLGENSNNNEEIVKELKNIANVLRWIALWLFLAWLG